MWAFAVFDTSNHLTISKDLQHWLSQHGLNILVILIGAWLLRRFGVAIIDRIIRRTVRHDIFPTELDRKKRIDTLNSLVSASVRIGVWLLAAVMIVDELGINTAPLLASAGVVGIALGFGAQSLIKDFVSGIFIIIENQYRVGDVVELGDVSGVVEGITIRTTILRDGDGNVHHVPNGSISITTNKTTGFSRINDDIVVDMDTNVDELEHIINHVGEEVAALPQFKHTLVEPPHFERVNGFQDFGLSVKIMGKTTPGDQWGVRSAFYRRLQKALGTHGIEIAYHPLMVKKSKKK